MKELGKYLHTTPQGLAIFKLKSISSIGTDVVDDKGRQVGIIADVFGPVASPYASVKLLSRSGPHLELDGAELYASERKGSSKRGKYGRP